MLPREEADALLARVREVRLGTSMFIGSRTIPALGAWSGLPVLTGALFARRPHATQPRGARPRRSGTQIPGGGDINRERLMVDWKPCGALGVHEHFIEIRCPVVVKRG